jgi:hypothetical protein
VVVVVVGTEVVVDGAVDVGVMAGTTVVEVTAVDDGGAVTSGEVFTVTWAHPPATRAAMRMVARLRPTSFQTLA